jgi:PAS domain S-box-containing protein
MPLAGRRPARQERSADAGPIGDSPGPDGAGLGVAAQDLVAQILEVDPDGVVFLDLEGRFIFANPAAERILGVSREKILSKTVVDTAWRLAGPDGRPLDPDSLPNVAALRAGHPLHGVEISVVRPDGERIVLSVSAAPLRGPGGEAVGVVASFRDVTEQKFAEATLRTLLEKHRLVEKATNDTIWDWCLLSDHVTYSEAAAGMLGYDPAEVGSTDTWWSDRVHPDDLERVNRTVREVLEAGEDAWATEYRFRRGDGTWADILERGYVLRNERGEPVRMVGTMQNITARRRAEEAQRFLAEASRALATSLDLDETLGTLTRLAVPRLADHCIIDLFEESGEVRRVAEVHADPAMAEVMCELRRYSGDPTLPTWKTEALSRGEPVRIPQVTDELLRDAARNDRHLELLRRLGMATYVSFPLIARGRLLGALTLGALEAGRFERDDGALAEALADRAALAVENARLYMEAQRASQAKSDFLAVMSHELRTPLTAVIGYAELLERGISGPVNPTQQRHLGHVKESAWHLLRLIDEILYFARMDAGRDRVERERVRLAELLAGAAGMIEAAAREKGLRLRVEAPDAGDEVETDAGKVRQILLNLLSNAVKFTDVGEVWLVGEVGPDGLTLEVGDTGVGIAEGHLDRIFEPFWQADQSMTRRTGGAGLGLSVTRQLVRRLGGEITVESAPGRGSVFRVTLPHSPVDAQRGGGPAAVRAGA